MNAFGFEPLQMRQSDAARRRGFVHAAQTYAAVSVAVKPNVQYGKRQLLICNSLLVEFELEEVEGGIMLSVVESGLDKIPLERRATVMRLNSSGCEQQMENIKKHVATA